MRRSKFGSDDTRDRRNRPLRVVLGSHGVDFAGGAEFAFDELVAAFHKVAPSMALTAVFPRPEGSLIDAMQTRGVPVESCLLPRWAEFRGFPSITMLFRVILLPLSIQRAKKLLSRLDPDVVITNTMVIPVLAIAARMLGIPHIWIIHEFGRYDHKLTFLLGYRRTIRLLVKLSTEVVCCSEAVARSLRCVATQGRVRSIYGAVGSFDANLDLTRTRLRRSGDPLRVVLVGRIAASKGQRVAVDATRLAREMGADVQLDIVGPGDNKEVKRLRRYVQDRGMLGAVRLVGNVTDMTSVYLSADVALMCSRIEAFGRVTVEAMKFGVPVCGSDSGGTREIIEHEESGLLFPPGDSEGLAKHLHLLWADEAFRRALGERASQHARAHFSLEQHGLNMLGAVQQAAKRPA